MSPEEAGLPPFQPAIDGLFLGPDVLYASASRYDAGVRQLWRLARLGHVALLSSPRTAQEARLALLEYGDGPELDRLLEDVTLVPDVDRRTTPTDCPDWMLYLAPAFIAGATHLITTIPAVASVRDQVYGGHLIVMSPGEYLAAPPGTQRMQVQPPGRKRSRRQR